jgi:long-chain acyl-CoA synthetase
MNNLNVTNLYLAFKEAADNYSDLVAFKAEGGRGRSYTYAEVNRMVRQLAAGLCESAFDDVREIGLLSENRPEWPICYLAVLAAGKSVIPIDANLKNNEIGYILDHSGLKAVFCSAKFENILAGLSSELDIYSFDENSPRNYYQLFRNETDYTGNNLAGLDGTASLIYTSGTTGNPKAVILTHDNLLGNLESIRETLQFTVDDVFLSVLPLHHTFEVMCGFLAPITSGSSIVYARSLKSNDLFEDIAANGITIMCGVPLLFEKMYRNIKRGLDAVPAFKKLVFRSSYATSSLAWKLKLNMGRPLFKNVRDKTGLGTIRLFVSGGAPLPPEISRFFNFLGFVFLQGYGLSECSPVVSVNIPGDIVFGSVGPPLKNLEVRIIEPDANDVGEIAVRGRSTTPGYRDNPVETEKLYHDDNWLLTGDLGYIKNGKIWITGRRKNLIVSAAGKNIYPEELEEKLMASAYVAETVVFGRSKDGRQGEEVRAIIVPDLEQFRAEFNMSKEQPDIREIRRVIGDLVTGINNEIASYKRIAGFEVQLEELEKTSTKKVKRFLYS